MVFGVFLPISYLFYRFLLLASLVGDFVLFLISVHCI